MCQDCLPLNLHYVLLPEFVQPLPDHQELPAGLEVGEEARDRRRVGDDRDTERELVEIEAAEILLGEVSDSVENKIETREVSDQVVHSDDPLHLSNKVVDEDLDKVDDNEKTQQENISCYKEELVRRKIGKKKN